MQMWKKSANARMIKHRISRFYENDQESIFALYEDTKCYVHYKDMHADMEPEIMPASVFYNEYEWVRDE